MTDAFADDPGELDPPPRLLMGPGPVDVAPRVLRAMSMPMLGQFDPAFTRIMGEVQALYRSVWRTASPATVLVDGTARAGIEAALVSLVAPGDRVLVPIFGRFGHLLAEIAERAGGEVIRLETEWGRIFPPEEIAAAVLTRRPRVVAMVHGDTSTTMAQPLDGIAAACREAEALLYVDATATLGGNPFEVDAWGIDAATAGLQKCLSGPPGIAPLTLGPRAVAAIAARRHVEAGIRPAGFRAGDGPRIRSNYFDLGMILDYWGESRLNHHTEATPLVYAARECARMFLAEGHGRCLARHRLASGALAAGLAAMGLRLFGDPAHRMANVVGVLIPEGVPGEEVRQRLLLHFGIEIGTSFGPLAGHIWRIGTMGYGARKENVLRCLAALEAVLRRTGFRAPPGDGVDTAFAVFETAERARDEGAGGN